MYLYTKKNFPIENDIVSQHYFELSERFIKTYLSEYLKNIFQVIRFQRGS